MIHQLSEIIADFLLKGISKKLLFLKQNMTYTLMVMNQFGRKAVQRQLVLHHILETL